jgi:hypothetical protein
VGSELAEAFDLGVVTARSSMVALCDNPILDDEDCPDSWIGTGLPYCLFRFL